jgi:hypothetical protein
LAPIIQGLGGLGYNYFGSLDKSFAEAAGIGAASFGRVGVERVGGYRWLLCNHDLASISKLFAAEED